MQLAWSLLLLWLRPQSRRSHWNHAVLVQRRRKSGMLGKYLAQMDWSFFLDASENIDSFPCLFPPVSLKRERRAAQTWLRPTKIAWGHLDSRFNYSIVCVCVVCIKSNHHMRTLAQVAFISITLFANTTSLFWVICILQLLLTLCTSWTTSLEHGVLACILIKWKQVRQNRFIIALVLDYNSQFDCHI